MAFYRKRKKGYGQEDKFHIAVFNYIRMQFPKVLCVHVPNEGKRTPSQGKKLKDMGMKKGFPDLAIFLQRERIINGKVVVSCGLAIELKVIYANGSRNKASKEQEEVLIDLNNNGWETYVIWDFDKAKKVIDEYCSLK